MNPLNNAMNNHKRPRPVDSPRTPYFPGRPFDPSTPLPSSPSSASGMSGYSHLASNPQLQAAPTSNPNINLTPSPSAASTMAFSSGSSATGSGSSSSSFRNVSACNRCRLRKNRCDQNLPACSSCEKAHVKCVGYDPITKREIPRAYVYYLERRMGYLEGLLRGAGIAYAPPEEFDVGPEDAHSRGVPGAGDGAGAGSRRTGFAAQGQGSADQSPAGQPVAQQATVLRLRERSLSPISPRTTIPPEGPEEPGPTSAARQDGGERGDRAGKMERSREREQEIKQETEAEKLEILVGRVGMVSMQGASDPRYLGSVSGISFARVVFAAVRSSISGSAGDRKGSKAGGQGAGRTGTSSNSAREGGGAAAAVSGPQGQSMRDSFFGLQSRPAFKKAAFPERELGARLVQLYFEHANAQFPILHRGEFMSLFDKAYASEDRKRTPRELYMLNIVFAIGAGIFLGAPDGREENKAEEAVKQEEAYARTPSTPNPKRVKFERILTQPEEYHASAMVHLENFLGSSPAADRPEGFGGSLEELQAVLLLAEFALHRPVAPGLWYITGVALRLAVDLGLHHEDGTGIEDSMGGEKNPALSASGFHEKASNVNSRERGRREWVRDLRRRLWWCCYSFDRLVSTCVGRPFGVSDQVITTEFPTVLDDEYILTTGFSGPREAAQLPSYKRVSLHYFRLRLLQSEILQVLQYTSAQQTRRKRLAAFHASRTADKGAGPSGSYEFMHTQLASPFLEKFAGFAAWRRDIDRRLYEWNRACPSQQDSNVAYSTVYLELEYWQAVIMLYRQSLTVPAELGPEDRPPPDEVGSSPLRSEMPRSARSGDFGAEARRGPGAGAGGAAAMHEAEEDRDEVFLKVAEAGQNVLRIYRQLHRVRLVNYTFLATHHLFMAGIAFLYALWHSKTVRLSLTFDDVDFTVLAATSVLSDLIEKCPPAEACRDAFDRMARATVQMCIKTTGLAQSQPVLDNPPPPPQQQQMERQHSAPMEMDPSTTTTEGSTPTAPPRMQVANDPHQYMVPAQSDIGAFQHRAPARPRPQFDMNLRDLFPEETAETQQFRRVSLWQVPPDFGDVPLQQQLASQQGSAGMHGQMQRQPQAMQALPSQPLGSNVGVGVAYTTPPRSLVTSPPSQFGSSPAQSTYSQQSMASAYSMHQQQQAQAQQQQQIHAQHMQAQAQAQHMQAQAQMRAQAQAQAQYAAQQQQQQQTSPYAPAPYPTSMAGAADVGFDPQYRSDLDSLLADSTQSYTGHPGLSLGFDNEHDWNDGGGVDLFEGFFFGGWNGQAPNGAQGMPGMGGVGGGAPMDLGMEEVGPRPMV